VTICRLEDLIAIVGFVTAATQQHPYRALFIIVMSIVKSLPTSAELPVDSILPGLLETLAHHNRCLLVAQPGAGKTTRVPLALLGLTVQTARQDCQSGKWLLLEPRRVAARLAAGWMAEQLGENPGDTVGYRIRGESRVSARTRLEVVTQGILTRMLQDDPALQGIRGIIFDEFHERSLDADLGLALALDVQQGLREDLKLLVMSATLDVASLLSVLGENTPLIESQGRVWPVLTHYRPMPARELPERHQARVIREALANHPPGHVLVFLPGQREIRRLQQLLLEALPANTQVFTLHGQMPLSEQQAVLRPPPEGPRRVILTTAIAESSLTVPGVRIVIDAGRERVSVFQPRSGLSRLETRQVNRASADQRRGRAGREADGICYRLWAEDAILVAHREPEIMQADLAGLVFELLRWGVNDAASLPWVSPPPAAGMAAGLDLLIRLGLVAKGQSLTAAQLSLIWGVAVAAGQPNPDWQSCWKRHNPVNACLSPAGWWRVLRRRPGIRNRILICNYDSALAMMDLATLVDGGALLASGQTGWAVHLSSPT
jgi:ATP-dependent helicase HrpB